MQVAARYYDGLTADAVDVTCRLDAVSIHVADRATNAPLADWPLAVLHPLHARRGALLVGASGKPGARLVFAGETNSGIARAAMPGLARHHRSERSRQWRLMGLATFALVSVVVSYVYGVPLLASRLTSLIPPAWEEQVGATVARQIEAALTGDEGFEVCDPDPQSLANRAIARFAAAVLDGSGSPFGADVKVIRSQVPNAFALPGGKAFYFSALLERTESADEFAGVLAHELGHVAYRHAMQQLIASAGTGLLIGFILGDMTGISIAGGLGVALIDSSFSRDAEAEADRFAADAAQRLRFQPSGLANLLERVAGDDAFSQALALLSTHPLTAERRWALESYATSIIGAQRVFSDAEWQAIRHMCDPVSAPAARPAPRPAPVWPPRPPGGG